MTLLYPIQNNLKFIDDHKINADQIILISKIASALVIRTAEEQFQILKKASPINQKIHIRKLDDKEIHIYLKDNSTNRQCSLGTNKSFCSATYICIKKNNQITILRIGRLKLRFPVPFDFEYYSLDVQNMLREIKLTQNLNHPNIVSYSDFFIFERSDKIKKVYAYAPIFERDILSCEQNLFSCMTEEEKKNFILLLCEQVLQALSYLHEKGIIHNDIKHRNIYYSNKEGKNYFAIGDFGLANNKIDSDFKGSLEFLPPEKAVSKGFIEADYIDSGFGTDLWDLGVTIYTLWEGKFNLFSKLMRKEFELHGLINSKTYANVENASKIIDKLQEEENNTLIERIDYWISLLKKDTKKNDEMEKWIRITIDLVKRRASDELRRMENCQLPMKEKDPIGHLLWHLLQPDPAKRISAEKALIILKS